MENCSSYFDEPPNLVGALILLVVLVIAITKDVVGQSSIQKPPESGPLQAAKRPILPLQERISLLQNHVKGVDREIDTLNGRMGEIRAEVEALLQKVQAVQPPKEEKRPPPKTADVKEIPFRLPFERLVVGGKNISFIVESSPAFPGRAV